MKTKTEVLIWHLLKASLDADEVFGVIAYLEDNEWMIDRLTKYLQTIVNANRKMTYPEVMEYIHKLEKGQMDPFQKKTEE